MEFDRQHGLSNIDLVVVGSGAGGLTAALTASLVGLKTIVLEHDRFIGGTSARSSGSVWIPDNHHMRAHGVTNDRELAARYLDSLVADRGDPDLWNAFLENGPKMLLDLERSAGISFRPYMTAPDYRQDHPGAALGGRPLEPLPFDGRELQDDFSRLAWPIPELMVFGKMMVTRGEAADLIRADRSLRGLKLAVGLLSRYVIDRLSYQRGTRLVLGNALIGSLVLALRRRNVPILTNVQCKRLATEHGRVSGIDVAIGDTAYSIAASKGVVLAGGGFPANRDWRTKYLPEPVADYTPAASGCDASTIKLALDIGASLGPAGLDNALWFPSSIATRADGSTAVYPHIVLDRAKPGLIAVNQRGKRFVNEAVSYHEFVRGMYRAHEKAPAIPAYLICDRAFIRRYGLGIIRPRTPSLAKFVKSGYLQTGKTFAELALRIGVPPEPLQATVARYNALAEIGRDGDFNKGENPYERGNGDANVKPNPCLGPLRKPPFYALPVYPTPLGTSLGLLADVDGRVCTAERHPIEGLYVCGNDMQSAFGGEYPGAGGQLGQAMTFGWIAARHAARTNFDVTDAPATGAAE